MKKKGKDVWLNIGSEELNYHERQYIEPYRSTVSFIEFLKKTKSFNTNSRFRVLDVGTGAGANIFWLSKEFPLCEFVGIDISPDLIALAKKKQRNVKNTEFHCLNLKESEVLGKFDCILSFQLLSWLSPKEADRCLKEKFSQAKTAVAMTSLFCEDDLDYEVKIEDRYNKRVVFYNIYSIPRIREVAKKFGFYLTDFERFELDIDIPKRKEGLGTYTLPLKNGKRLQFSGCMNLPWYFLLFKKDGGV